jgi:glyoxylase-like metal-dependent hydrolase (beta-lactamase superfamily II)
VKKASGLRAVRHSVAGLALFSFAALPATAQTAVAKTAVWDAYAIRYGRLLGFRVASLIAGADTARRSDAALTVWLLRGPNGRNVLVDAGFKRADLIARWKPANYMRPDSAVMLAGVKPSQITDVIISHIHWDHFDGADLFPNARIWIQKDEVEHHIDAAGKSLDRAIDAPDAEMLSALRSKGRLSLVDGDAKEIIPGITVYTGGKHTFQSQYAGVRTAKGTIIIASDNMYLYENLSKHLPIAQTLDAASNLAAQDRMKTIAVTPAMIIPGHDAAVFDRFPKISPNVAHLVVGAPPTTNTAITAADLRQRLFAIADDSMMGRETGSLGAFKAADYAAAEFRRLGLQPAGENGTYFQTVPFWSAMVDPKSRISVNGRALQLGVDFLPSLLSAPPRTLNNATTLYVGSLADTTTTITAAQAAGKVIVFDYPAGARVRQSTFNAAVWSGAAALVIPALDAVGVEVTARLREGRPMPDNERNPDAVPTLWVTRKIATEMLGADPAILKPGATGALLSGYFDIARTPVAHPARNVIAVLRGSDPKLRGQYVALSAHNDHVGFDHFPVDHDSIRAFDRVIRPMGADSPMRIPSAVEWTKIHTILHSLRKVNTPRLDSIRNGADDDGSGMVGLLEIAEVMSRSNKHPKRSILFVNHTAEEAGLLGSRYFTDHPTVPLDSIIAEIDQDMTGRGLPDDFPLQGVGAATPQYLEVIGAKRISKEFGDSVEAANARQPMPFKFDYAFDAPGHPLQYYCRADHYSYARYGIPSLAVSRGSHLDYHQVTDEAQYIDYPDLTRVTKMVYTAAKSLGNMSHRPKIDVPKPTDPHGQCKQ